MPPSSTTDLAHGTINDADELFVQLIRPTDMPPVVRIVWPLQSTMVSPKSFPEVAAMLTKVVRRSCHHAGPNQGPETTAVTELHPAPRPHGWLWEIMSFLGQLLVIIMIIAAFAAVVLWLFDFI